MVRFIIVGLISGILFWLLEGVINGNPYAQKVYQVYKPIMKTSLNIPVVFLIYLVYGFALAGIFLFLYQSLPGGIGVMKGISFALLTWFFRGFMGVLSLWMTFAVPPQALVYQAIAGLTESLILGVLYGLALRKFF